MQQTLDTCSNAQCSVLVSQTSGSSVVEKGHPLKAALALASILFICTTSALDALPLALSVITSICALVFFRVLTTREAFGAVSVKAVVVIGISLAFSTALVNTSVANNVAVSTCRRFSL